MGPSPTGDLPRWGALTNFGYERGVTLSQKGSESDCREAVKLLRQALREQPDYAQAASLLGRMHQVLYEFEPALEYHRKAVSLDETSVEARLHYAAALLDLQDTNEAVLQINEALARAPRNSMAHTHLAHAYLLNEAYAETEKYARRALALDHGNAQAHLWLGESLRLQKKFDESKKNYQRYLALSDFDSKLHEQVLYYAIGMGFSKRRATQKAVHRDHRAIAYLGLCQCEEQMDRLSQAARFCGEALNFDPNSPNTYYSLGRIYAKKFLLTNSCAFLRDSEESFQKMLALNSEADQARTAKETLAAIAKAKSRCN